MTQAQQKLAVFDCDDCILNWIGGFCDYHNKHYGTNVDGSQAPNYDLSTWMDVDKAVLQQRMYEFNRSWEFGCLEPMRYAVEAIRYLRDYNREVPEDQRIRVSILSKCGNDATVRNLRISNLVNVFGPDCFDDIVLIEPTERKQPYLQEMKNKYNLVLFVDDYVGNCNEAYELGINTVVIQRTHNKHLKERNPHLHFCRDWMHLLSVHLARHIRVE